MHGRVTHDRTQRGKTCKDFSKQVQRLNSFNSVHAWKRLIYMLSVHRRGGPVQTLEKNNVESIYECN